jgi:Predicted membrane protein
VALTSTLKWYVCSAPRTDTTTHDALNNLVIAASGPRRRLLISLAPEARHVSHHHSGCSVHAGVLIVASSRRPAGCRQPNENRPRPCGPGEDLSRFRARDRAERVPNGSVSSEELERENGHLIYSFDVKVPGKSGIQEVNVNALSGKVLGVHHEGPAAEKKEARADSAAARKTSSSRASP